MSKKTTIDQIAALLEHEAADRRRAAAIVLGELEADQASALDGLRAACRNGDDPELRRCAAEAIGQIAPKTIIKDLRPLLKDPVERVREAAKQVLASGRGVTADDVAAMLESKDERQKIGAVAVLGAMGSETAQQRILAQLDGASPKLLTAIQDALTPLYTGTDDDAAYDALEDLNSATSGLEFGDKGPLGSTVVALAAAIGLEGGAELLMRVAKESSALPPRTEAIEAMRRLVRSKKLSQKVFRFLIDLLEDAKTPAELLSPIADTLDGLDVPINQESRVRALLSSETTAVRRWAIKALGSLDTAPAARAVAQLTEDGDPTDRAIALKAAIRTAAGRAALGRVLTKMTDEARAIPVASALKPHAEGLPRATITALEDAVADAPDAISGLVIELLEAAGAGNRVGQGVVFERAMRLKAAREYPEAAKLLKRITQGSQAPSEARFQLGVCELMSSRRVIKRGANSDPALLTFRTLSKDRSFDLMEALKKEEDFGDPELYYLGFSLAEQKHGEGLGGDVLTLVSEGDDPKLKRAAENKLRTMGWIDLGPRLQRC